MAVNLKSASVKKLYAIDGVRLGITEAGVRKANHKDLTVLLLDAGCSIGAVFTTNRYCAAPVYVGKAHLAHAAPSIRALVINTGIANAGTGKQGIQAAQTICSALADNLNVMPHEILPFSTGVIMEQLPVDKITTALPSAVASAHADQSNAWAQAASAIMTTDTVAKAASRQIQVADSLVHITGISKGSGMICPNMATMLGFIATDAHVAPTLMPQLTRMVADASFNRITVDGDTSTNDSFILIASNKATHAAPITDLNSLAGKTLLEGLINVAQELAQAIVRDGEGASKFISITVEGGKNAEECRQVAYTVAHSPLVKTAFFASDPNLGRILAAIGYAGIDDLNTEKIELFLDDVHVINQGTCASGYTETQGQQVMQQDEINLRIDLGRGKAADIIWTCDFSYEYVRINADYRS